MLIVKEIFNELVGEVWRGGEDYHRRVNTVSGRGQQLQIKSPGGRNGDQGFVLRRSTSNYVTNSV